ncbi:MAG: WecB/TagA/CpsF family glycosyltransferase [Candidatus Parcubacteria bacterium]|nr:WecB/TagA/CpsF family glycosyltransferase [Candidatus Parcubacteria bacterium]
MSPQIFILGTKINNISLNEAINEIADFMLTGDKKAYITTPNPEICLLSFNNKIYRRIHQNSFLSIPDGVGLKLGAKILGNKLNNITTGIDLCLEIIKLAEQEKYSILILGGLQEVGDRTISLCSYKYPKLKLNYLNGGTFNNRGVSDQTNLIEQINAINPDIIFTCLGAPKQEFFMTENLGKLNAKLMIGVGGTIDFLAEQIKRAPQSWRKLGLEWLWRLIQEPWRWKRILKAVIIFPLACIYWRFCNEFIYRKNVAAFIINDQKKILLAKQTRTDEWKLPQGGSKHAETKKQLESAIMREMSEELGTDKLEIISFIKNCYRYKFPRNNIYWNHDKFVGQKQTLFLLKFTGQDQDIKLDLNEHYQWQWVSKEDILRVATPKRQGIIKIGLNQFNQYL